MPEELSIALVGAVIGLLPVWGISLLLTYFIALGSPPSRRAAWTAGIAYVVATVALLFAGPEEYAWTAPFVTLPGTLIVFFYWRFMFRRAWTNDPDADPASLAHDDWRMGLMQLGAIVVVVIGVAFIRSLIRGY